ncbi:hypothetical protein Bbelb_051730 [Branchiostoma belcheri]|nr:hypothetical protein Bbelb_290710 [Branchiostoma belcheri]KAI8516592.1 hypothetical protein Bbelb_051730 [Branchiostoma belcheri]
MVPTVYTGITCQPVCVDEQTGLNLAVCSLPSLDHRTVIEYHREAAVLLSSHVIAKPYKCEECCEGLGLNYAGEKPCKCEECCEGLGLNYAGEKPYKCEECIS